MVEAPIDRVRVYSQGATVTRRLVLGGTVPAELEFSGVPLAAVDATVRVRCVGEGIVATGTRVGLHAKAPEGAEPDPDREALKAMEREADLLRDRIAQIDQECARLGALQVPARPRGKDGKPPPPSPMRARVALEQFTDTAIDARLTERREWGEQLERQEEQILALEDAIRRASTAKRASTHRITKTVRVEMTGSAKGETVVELDYFIPGARWAPQYRLDIAADGTVAHVALRALICQASGEDWRQVKLELSTAIPMQFTELPKLSSIRIGKRQPDPAVRGFRPAPKGAGVLFGDFDRDRQKASELLPRPTPFQGPMLSVHAVELQASYGSALRDEPMADMLVGGSLDDFDEEMEMVELAQPEPAPPPAPMMAKAMAAPREPSVGRARSKKKPAMKRRAMAPAKPAMPQRMPFAALRMGDAEGGSRGRLTAVDRAAQYLESLERTGLMVDLDGVQLVEEAMRAAASVASLPLPAGASSVRDAARHFDYAYTANDRVDVPSDRAFHSVPLGQRKSPCALSYVVVPREDANVFRMAQITNSERSPLLPGPAEVYVDGEYVLTTAMPMVAPRAKFELGLGVEQAIRCARNTQYRESRSGQAVVAMAELRHAIEIEIANQLPREIAIEVRERIPQGAPDAEVDVEEVDIVPAWEPWDQTESKGPELLGGRRWKIAIPAMEQSVLKATYIVKIYANNEVVGGNRREA